MATLKFKKLRLGAKAPHKGTPEAAGFDLFACLPEFTSEWLIAPGGAVKIPTGIAMEIPSGLCGIIRPRSSAFKRGFIIQGLIDSDYRGEVFVVVQNVSESVVSVSNGSSIAQILLVDHCANVQAEEVSELSSTDRGAGGFGSTGNT